VFPFSGQSNGLFPPPLPVDAPMAAPPAGSFGALGNSTPLRTSATPPLRRLGQDLFYELVIENVILSLLLLPSPPPPTFLRPNASFGPIHPPCKLKGTFFPSFSLFRSAEGIFFHRKKSTPFSSKRPFLPGRSISPFLPLADFLTRDLP